MDLGISGKIALVCASTGGLGRGVAEALSAEGARVVVTGRREEAVKQVAADLPEAVGVVCDLTDLDQVRSLVARAEEAAGGPVEILVLNGGGPPPGYADELDDEAFLAAFELLARGHRQLVADVLPGMRARGWGRVLAVGSSGVAEPLPHLAASNVGRAALAAYLKSLASTVAADGVTCNMILPGRIDTERVRMLDARAAERAGVPVEETVRASQATIPARRYGTTEEFGRTAAFLCSAPASYVNGSQVRVDGGLVRGY